MRSAPPRWSISILFFFGGRQGFTDWTPSCVLGLLRIVTSRPREFENRTYARPVFPDWRLLCLRRAMSQFRLEVASAARQKKFLHSPQEHTLGSCGNTLCVPARSHSPRILPPSSQSYPFRFGRGIRAQDFEDALWHISWYKRLFPSLTYQHGIIPANRYSFQYTRRSLPL